MNATVAARHRALARLGEPVETAEDMRRLIAERKARGWSMPRPDRWRDR